MSFSLKRVILVGASTVAGIFVLLYIGIWIAGILTRPSHERAIVFDSARQIIMLLYDWHDWEHLERVDHDAVESELLTLANYGNDLFVGGVGSRSWIFRLSGVAEVPGRKSEWKRFGRFSFRWKDDGKAAFFEVLLDEKWIPFASVIDGEYTYYRSYDHHYPTIDDYEHTIFIDRRYAEESEVFRTRFD